MSNEKQKQRTERVAHIIEILRQEYPDARCSLDYVTPHNLLVAAILAAQCTDERVNQVTPGLFRKYPDVQAFADADEAELEEIVRSTGFFRNKTKAIIASARELVQDFDGKVPETIEELTSLSGVGRKTANLIIGDAFGKPAVIVDTHVKRISGKLGLTTNTDPDKIEVDLRELLAEDESTHFNHLLVFHGRAVCKAPKPKCELCKIAHLCPVGMGG